MKLYYKAGACSLSPHIVLIEVGLPYTLESVDLKSKLTETGADFNTINPKGYVPVLQLDGGEVLAEGPAIVQYLADLAPAARLAPANGTLERVRLQEWLNFISTEIHKTYGPLFNPMSPVEAKDWAKATLGSRFDYVAQCLEGHDYLMGGFSVADAYLFTVMNWGRHVGVEVTSRPALAAYQARVAARPAVQQAMREEGLIK